MKILAILGLNPGASIQTVRSRLGEELERSWALYAGGVLREAYATPSASRVVFVLEAEDSLAAQRQLSALPLVAAGMFDVEIIELQPFVNWSSLFRA